MVFTSACRPQSVDSITTNKSDIIFRDRIFFKTDLPDWARTMHNVFRQDKCCWPEFCKMKQAKPIPKFTTLTRLFRTILNTSVHLNLHEMLTILMARTNYSLN